MARSVEEMQEALTHLEGVLGAVMLRLAPDKCVHMGLVFTGGEEGPWERE